MPLDAVCLRAVLCELRAFAIGAKIDKIYQPAKDEVIFALRGPRGSNRLLLSANQARPRPQFTNQQLENPAAPPMFCMLLRKHLGGGRIREVNQPPMERSAEFIIDTMDELGEFGEKRLILEAMGRHSNLILTDGEGRIIDCLRKVDMEMSARRQVLPGLFYRLPPAQEKINPLETSPEERRALLGGAPPEKQLSQWLLDTFSGISPLLCRELAFQAADAVDVRFNMLDENGKNRFLLLFSRFLEQIKEERFSPCMLLRDNQPVDFSCFPILQYGFASEIKQRDSFSALLDDFYALREKREHLYLRSQDLQKTAIAARDRTARKLNLQRQELQDAQDRDALRERGDIITSNLHEMKKGMAALHAVNYYDPQGQEVDIPLNPLLTPSQNAAQYYKRYNKAKNAAFYLSQQIAKGEADLQYLESVLEELSKAENQQDLQEIRRELLDVGYLSSRGKTRREKRASPSKPMEFRSSVGLRILVGRNNMQNDQLTLKTAFKSDLWFHVQKMPGSHVILRCEGKEPDLKSVTEAAILAAWFSGGREGKNVPVDYTLVRYVKKPGGARPGMVVYDPYNTAYVSPDEDLIRQLRI